MKKHLRQVKILGAAVLLAVSGVVVAGIAGTKHDLSNVTGTTSASGAGAAGSAEVCVFCHTPHAARPAAEGPLWNRALGAAPTGLYANTESMDGLVLTPNTGSLACLSCHDGLVAMNSIVNAPGSGMQAAASALYTFTAVGNPFTAGKITSAGGNLGSDLSNDHPIGVAYCGGFVTAGGSCADGDFFTANLFRNGAASMTNAGVVSDKWWVETGANTTRNKTDLILYARSFTYVGGVNAGGPFFQPSVECATCHDVHGGLAGTQFLRVSNSGSGLCLTCHNK